MRNQGVILAVAISFLVIAFVFIYVSQFYIPNQNERIAEGYKALYQNRGVFVVIGDDGLQEGTIITDELFSEGTIDIQNIPSSFIPKKNGIELVYTTGGEYQEALRESAIQTIAGKVVKTKIEPGSIITYASLGEGEDVAVDSFKKQIQLKVENTVGVNLKTGKYVDIITKYENGEYDIVASKIIIDSVISTGVVEQTDESSTQEVKAVTDGVILVSLNDREYRDIELAQRLGKLSIRLYKSVEQYASAVTFDYDLKMREVNKSIKDYELEGAHTEYYLDYPMYMTGKNTISKESEKFVYMEWYSDLYFRLEPFFKGYRIYEKQEDADLYTEMEGEAALPTVTLEDLASYGDITKVDVLIALIMGNESVYSSKNRLELFTSYLKDNFEPATKIRMTVAQELVSTVLNYYTKYTQNNIDSLAYLISNGFITSEKIDNLNLTTTAQPQAK